MDKPSNYFLFLVKHFLRDRQITASDLVSLLFEAAEDILKMKKDFPEIDKFSEEELCCLLATILENIINDSIKDFIK